VRLTVAPEIFKMYRVFHTMHPGQVDRVAQLDGAPVDPEALAAELKHLRHEWQRI